jgi:carboxymethylenebutenolidase
MSTQLDCHASDYLSLVPPPLPLDRRGFLVTALGAGFALAVQPVMAQTAINTSTDGLLAGEVNIPTADGAMPAYRAQPSKGAAFPVVLVVSEIFGAHEHIKDICRRLAKLGYMAIAPELFARQGNPRELKSVKEILEQIVSKTPDAQVMSDLDASVAWAKTQSGDVARLAITGFCWGGRITWLYAAHNPALKAAVAWYGRLEGVANERTPKHPIDVVADLKAPVLGLYGGVDEGIPLESVDKMEAALQSSGKTAKIEMYDNAPHAFHADYRPSYRKEEAVDAWQKMHAWFKKYGV